MREVKTETKTYYTVECRYLTGNREWFFLSDRYAEIAKYSKFGEAKERIPEEKARNKAFGCKYQMEFRIVRMTETITKEIVG